MENGIALSEIVKHFSKADTDVIENSIPPKEDPRLYKEDFMDLFVDSALKEKLDYVVQLPVVYINQ